MKKIVIILTMLVPMFFYFGCGKAPEKRTAHLGNVDYAHSWEGAGYMSEDAEASYYAPAYREVSNLFGNARVQSASVQSTPSGLPESGLSADLPDTERKLVKRANVSLRVDNLEKADATVTSLLETFNGYSATTTISENSHFYSLRIPAHQYDVFLTEMNGIGKLTHRSESTEDVTLRYYDLESRLGSKRELLRTYQSYLRRANNMEEILAVEAQISNLQQDIESTGTQLRYLANQVNYATIELRLHGPAAAASYQHESFGDKIKQLFGGFGGFLSTVAIILLGIVVYGIPSLAIAILLFWLLFGRIGLLKKLWQLVMVKKQG